MPRPEPFANRTNRRAVTAALRSARAVELRAQGYSFAQIAKELGYATPYSAWRAVHNALQKLPVKHVETYRRLEIERTEMALRAIYPKVLQGDLHAVRRWTELIELECRILGLFATTKVEHSVVDNDSDPLYRLLDALARRVEAQHVGTAAVPAPRGSEGDSAE